MGSDQKALPSPPPPSPRSPPKNGNTRGRPPLVSMKLGDMEGVILRRGSARTSRHELYGPGQSGRHEPSRSGRHGLPPRHSRVVARLGLAALGTVAAVEDKPYVCADCSMTFGRETALRGHMRLHNRDHISSNSEEDAPTPKRRKKPKSKLRTVKPLEATWGNHARRNGTPRGAATEVKVSRSNKSNVSNEISENDRNDNEISVIADDDDDSNPIITITGSHGDPSLAPGSTVALAMAPTPVVAVSTPMLAPHVVATSLAAASTTPHAITVIAATQTAPDLVKGNNDSGQASNANYGKGVAGYSDAGYKGKGVVGCTVTRGESKVYSCQKCNMFFYTPEALRGHTISYHMIIEKDKEKLDLHSGLLKCKVCNHVCHTGQELNFHMRNVHPHPCIADVANKEKTFEVTGINNKGTVVDGPYNTMGRQIPAGAPRSVILALPAPNARVHQPPQGTMAMAGNPVTSHFLAANTSIGRSLSGTSRILPAIPMHNQEQNPREHIAAVALGNHRHGNINPALFSFSKRQEIAMVPSNSIVSSSSTPCPGAAPAESSQALGINNYIESVDAPANSMGRRFPFYLAGRSDTQALPVSWPVHHPTQGMAMDGNTLTGHFPAAISTAGWSFPATTSNVLPAIPMQTQEQNPPEQIAAMAPGNHGHHNINPALFSFSRRQKIAVVPSNSIASRSSTPRPGIAAPAESSQALGSNNYFESIDALANTMGRWLPFYQAGRSDTQALPVSWPVHHPTQGMAMDGNPLTGHFPAAISTTGRSFPATTSNVLPAVPLQTQEENPHHGRVVPADGEHPSTRLFGCSTFPTFQSHNQVENPPEEIVPGNNEGRTIRLFGTNITEGQKEVKEPK